MTEKMKAVLLLMMIYINHISDYINEKITAIIVKMKALQLLMMVCLLYHRKNKCDQDDDRIHHEAYIPSWMTT